MSFWKLKIEVEIFLVPISCLLEFLPPLDPDPNKKLGVWIRNHMDIFGILDPDPHENLCRFETLYFRYHATTHVYWTYEHTWVNIFQKWLKNKILSYLQNKDRSHGFVQLLFQPDHPSLFVPSAVGRKINRFLSAGKQRSKHCLLSSSVHPPVSL